MARLEKARLLLLALEDRAAYLTLALPDAALRRVSRKVGLSFPGYRLEKVPGAELARALAEEYETDPRVAGLIDGSLDDACRVPLPITAGSIRPGMVRPLTLAVAAPPEATVPLLWHFLSHPVEKVRQAGVRALDDYLGFLHGMIGHMEEDRATGAVGPPVSRAGAPGGARGDLRRRLRESEGRAAALGRDIETIREQVDLERRQVALRDERLAELKTALAESERRLRASEESRSALEAMRDRDAGAEARHHMAEAARRAREAEALQAELALARRREAEILSRLRAAESSPAPAAPPPREEPPPDPGASFQIPVFSAEFYDSIHRWDIRIVRAAFEKALLLCQNVAHPGLDAKPMEGADGLYRIRVAQDVRLFYRRLPGGRLEILSLIDREDLDRYIHRYRTRVTA